MRTVFLIALLAATCAHAQQSTYLMINGQLYTLPPGGVQIQMPGDAVNINGQEYRFDGGQRSDPPMLNPAAGGAVNADTGEFYPRAGSGFVDPNTGQFYPGSGAQESWRR